MPFNLPKLVLDTMFAAIGKQNSALPYGCLITRILLFFKVTTTGYESIVPKEHIDAKNLAQSNLRIAHGTVEHIVTTPSQPTDDTVDTTTSASSNLGQLVSKIASDTATLVGNHTALVAKISDLEGEITVLKTMVSMLIGKEVPVVTLASKKSAEKPTTSAHLTPNATIPTGKDAPGDDIAKDGSELRGSVDVDV